MYTGKKEPMPALTMNMSGRDNATALYSIVDIFVNASIAPI